MWLSLVMWVTAAAMHRMTEEKQGPRVVLEWKRAPMPGRQAVRTPLGEQWTYTFCTSSLLTLGLDEVNPHISAEGTKPCGDRVSE